MRWRLVSCRYELKFESPNYIEDPDTAKAAAETAAEAAIAATEAPKGKKVALTIAAEKAAVKAAVYDKLTAMMIFIGVDAAKLGRAIELSSAHAESGR
eukprot:scaffold21221_cov60-Phaeocystis_antarctica.AAC.8